jgi:hypothetical protein
MPVSRRRPSLLPLAALAVAAACTTIVEELPSGPSAPGGAPTVIPVVVVPVPVPTPPPAPPPPAPNPPPPPSGGPTPPPAAPPPAVPPPAPPPSGGSCSLGQGPGNGVNCPKTGPSFLGEIDTAINRTVQQQPGNFNLNDQRGNGGYRIHDIDAFLAGVVNNLRAMGLCAMVDGGGEIAVKNTNSFSDQYDLILSSGHIFRGGGSYAATCTPAWF